AVHRGQRLGKVGAGAQVGVASAHDVPFTGAAIRNRLDPSGGGHPLIAPTVGVAVGDPVGGPQQLTHVAAARPDVAERKLELEVELLGGEELAQCGQRLSPSPGVANRPSALSLMSSKRSTERLQQNPSSRTAVALNFNPRRTGTGSQPTTTTHPFVQTTACIAVNLVPYRRAWPRVCPELCS